MVKCGSIGQYQHYELALLYSAVAPPSVTWSKSWRLYNLKCSCFLALLMRRDEKLYNYSLTILRLSLPGYVCVRGVSCLSPWELGKSN